MKILPYELKPTDEKLTSRAGLSCVLVVLERLGLEKMADALFAKPRSNRGYRAGEFVKTFLLTFFEGGRSLEDVQLVHNERTLLGEHGIKRIPGPDAMARWLRRFGSGSGGGLVAVGELNRVVLGWGLQRRRWVTLDIDATAFKAKKSTANRNYCGDRGYTPMVGTVNRSGQVVLTEFREGKCPPSKDNIGFLKRCIKRLPHWVRVKWLRIDAAGYQKSIIEYCEQNEISYVIRARMCGEIRELIKDTRESDWKPLRQRDGSESPSESVFRCLHVMDDMDQAFTLVIQRQRRNNTERGVEDGPRQPEFPFLCIVDDERIESDKYVFRAIATNMDEDMDDSEIIHFYNQRGEHSENRIKELCSDFAARRVPCDDIDANALYFALSALAFNVLALMRQVLPVRFECSRAPTVRKQVFAMAGRFTRHARKVTLSVSREHYEVLTEVLSSVDQLLRDIERILPGPEPPPTA